MSSHTEKINAATCCVLSYNRPRFLETGLASLVENAGAELELVIHDDGSTDPEVDRILTEWQQRGATVIRNAPGHNQGQGVALNRMFGMAAGDPIIKLDQDLTYHPEWLATVQHILHSNRGRSFKSLEGQQREPRIGLLGLMHYWIDPVNSMKCKVADHYGATWQEHTHILGSGFAVPREIWRRLGPFEEHSPAFAEDWQFQRKVTDSKKYVCALPAEDLATNNGMGPPHSTVVVAPPSAGKEAVIQSIHFRPFTFNA